MQGFTFIPIGNISWKKKENIFVRKENIFFFRICPPSQGDLCLQALKILFKGGRWRMVLEPYLVDATAKLHKRAEKRKPAAASLW